MLNERVGMIRAAGKQDREAMLLSAVCKDVHRFLVDGRDIFMLCVHGSLVSFLTLLCLHAVTFQKVVELLFEEFLILEVDYRRHDLIVKVHG